MTETGKQHDERYHPGADYVLAMFVNTCNELDVEMDVTVLFGGGLLSGTLISRKKYFVELGKRFEKALGTDGFQNSMKEFEQMIGQSAGAVRYIHMRDARFYSPGQRPLPDNGFDIWRGRLDEAQGFSFGKFDVS